MSTPFEFPCASYWKMRRRRLAAYGNLIVVGRLHGRKLCSAGPLELLQVESHVLHAAP
jgi:hypothetical protein